MALMATDITKKKSYSSSSRSTFLKSWAFR